jgi:hypothetical protein
MAREDDSAPTGAEITHLRLGARSWLAAGAAVTTIVLTAGAFWLSYQHLHDVAAGNGLHDVRSWAWPGTVDLFIILGELLILRASLAGRVDAWAIALAASGSLGSIALNIAGVGWGAPGLTYVVAAVPPVAALLAFGALMRQVHEYLAEDDAPAEPASAHEEPQAEQAAAEPATPDALVWQDVQEALQPVAQDTETVELMTVSEVATAKGVAEGTVRSWVNRNKLAAVRRNDDGRLLFHPAAVAALD